MSDPAGADDMNGENCIRCDGVLVVRSQPDPRPLRPLDRLLSYTCVECRYEVFVHEYVNPAVVKPLRR